MPHRIEDYALLSDCHRAALVSRSGSIDWMCLPRFDSAACFASLLGTEENGFWRIGPASKFRSRRQYVDGTMVLQTTFETETGTCRLTDCLLVEQRHPLLVRQLEGLEGWVKMELELVIRFDYGSIVPWVSRLRGDPLGIKAVAGPDTLYLLTPVPLTGKNLRTKAALTVRAGEQIPFQLLWCPSHETPSFPPANVSSAVESTSRFWKNWTNRRKRDNLPVADISRSLLTLKALTYEPTGGIVAAPTTSLPERLGGERNWDYRFCWLRDSTFTLYSLLNAGYREEAERWQRWLVRAVAGTPSQVNIMYGLSGERRLNECALNWLNGYENSKPVRIGNAAYRQTQLDVFGEVMDTLHLARRHGLSQSEESWSIQKTMVSHLAQQWMEPDEGIWEIRGPRRHFTHSKVMAWVAVDRAIKGVREFGLEGPVSEWKQLRDRIKSDICANGYNAKLGAFVQYYGGNTLDASLLLMSLVGFLDAKDPRLKGTVDAIQKRLVRDGLVLRYDTETSVDGLAGEEGAFLACSFWLADNLILLGRRAEAMQLFRHLSSLSNDVGLFAEEYSPTQKRMLGNFPQAFSHIAHVNTAKNLAGAGPADDRSRAGMRNQGLE